jgi:hypothetical protein
LTPGVSKAFQPQRSGLISISVIVQEALRPLIRACPLKFDAGVAAVRANENWDRAVC